MLCMSMLSLHSGAKMGQIASWMAKKLLAESKLHVHWSAGVLQIPSACMQIWAISLVKHAHAKPVLSHVFTSGSWLLATTTTVLV